MGYPDELAAWAEGVASLGDRVLLRRWMGPRPHFLWQSGQVKWFLSVFIFGLSFRCFCPMIASRQWMAKEAWDS